jgi:HTH-type transcriptional regulator / antitoxin HigA
MIMSTHLSAKTFHPGRLLIEELDRRGWTQADFAHIIGRPPRVVNEIIKGKRAITPETALAFAGAFGNDAEFWLNMESAYQLSRVRVELAPIARRAQLYQLFPIRDMQKRGWIPETKSVEKLERSVLEFFGGNSLTDTMSFAHSAKRTSYEQPSAIQSAWLYRAKYLSTHQDVGKYLPKNLPALYRELKRNTREPDDVMHVPELLASIGIRFAVVEALPRSRIDGACFWLSQTAPVIALSLRYDRHDMFWHALFHELHHIDRSEGQTDPMLDQDLFVGSQDKPEFELRANNNAADQLISREQIERFIGQSRKSFSEASIRRFAEEIRVHPGIVVGRLQHDDYIPWSSYNFLKVKVRRYLVPYAVSDGFGVVFK